MNKVTLLALLFLSAAACASVRGDEAAVRATIAAYVQAFNDKKLDAVASHWAEQAIHMDRETGAQTEGREAIRADIAAVLKERPDTMLVGSVDRVRFIKPDVASVEGQASVGEIGEEPSVSAFSAILIEEDGKWLIDSIAEMPLPRPSTSYDALQELEWLVGRWVDQSDTVRVDTTVRWTADRAFLLRSYAVEVDGGIARQGTQVIGWDPRSHEIRSWSFNSDGSFGDGTWSKNGEDWLITSSQTLSDGRAASGTFVFTRVDNDTLSLKLVGHEIEGEPQSTKEAVKVVRVVERKQMTSSQSNEQ
jgi:uncharacterized protein (TIGR02246 family)